MSASLLGLFSLEGKNVIMTGATGGIGVTMAVALADAGADIVSIQMSHDPLGPALHDAITATGRKISVFDCNIKDHNSIKDTFGAIWKSGVAPDILVNCAGITRHMSVETTPVQDLDDVSSGYISKMLTLNIIKGHVDQFPSNLSHHSGIWEGVDAIRTAGEDYKYSLDGVLLSAD